MPITLALNYSQPAGNLLASGELPIDCWKVPDIPDIIDMAQDTRLPMYVHFALAASTPDAAISHKGQPLDWDVVAALADDTETPYINVHLTPLARDWPHIPPNSTEPAHVREVSDTMIAALTPVVARFGTVRVIVENNKGRLGKHLHAGASPDVYRAVVDALGCGFLFDVSHARLAATQLHMSVDDYLAALPLAATREMHLTGIRQITPAFLMRAARMGVPSVEFAQRVGQPTDHMPFTPDDWSFIETMLARDWPNLHVVAVEHGGMGGPLALMLDADALAADMQRLAGLLS